MLQFDAALRRPQKRSNIFHCILLDTFADKVSSRYYLPLSRYCCPALYLVHFVSSDLQLFSPFRCPSARFFFFFFGSFAVLYSQRHMPLLQDSQINFSLVSVCVLFTRFSFFCAMCGNFMNIYIYICLYVCTYICILYMPTYIYAWFCPCEFCIKNYQKLRARNEKFLPKLTRVTRVLSVLRFDPPSCCFSFIVIYFITHFWSFCVQDLGLSLSLC